MIRIIEYVDRRDKSPFASWFEALGATAAAKIAVALVRIEQGNLSNVKSVGDGVLEYRIDFGPGYRIYFGREGDALVILLAGGTKRRQQDDVARAKEHWRHYKERKKGN